MNAHSLPERLDDDRARARRGRSRLEGGDEQPDSRRNDDQQEQRGEGRPVAKNEVQQFARFEVEFAERRGIAEERDHVSDDLRRAVVVPGLAGGRQDANDGGNVGVFAELRVDEQRQQEDRKNGEGHQVSAVLAPDHDRHRVTGIA